MSADVIIAVLQTALLGFFKDLTTRGIKSPLHIRTRKEISSQIKSKTTETDLTDGKIRLKSHPLVFQVR